jgi:hypothetical protein
MRHRAPRPLLDLIGRPSSAITMSAFLVAGAVLAVAELDQVVHTGTNPARAAQVERATSGPSGSGLLTPTGAPGTPSSGTPGSGAPGGASSGASTPTSSPSRTAALKAASLSRSAADQVVPSTPPTLGPEPGPTKAGADKSPPSTTASTRRTTSNAWEVLFTANEASTFECSLDGGAYQPCSSPVRYPDLSPGWHTFAVRATDQSGNRDETPARLAWHSRGRGSHQP